MGSRRSKTGSRRTGARKALELRNGQEAVRPTAVAPALESEWPTVAPRVWTAWALMTAIAAASFLGGGYVVCPQQAQGLSRVLIAILVGLPAGNAIATLVLAASCLGMIGWRGPRIATAIRVVIERAGMGAMYGAILGTFSAAIHMGRVGASCQPDLMQTIGNGALWATMASFMFSYPVVVRSVQADVGDTPTGIYRMLQRNAVWTSVLIGFMTATSLTVTLAQGIGWPA